MNKFILFEYNKYEKLILKKNIFFNVVKIIYYSLYFLTCMLLLKSIIFSLMMMSIPLINSFLVDKVRYVDCDYEVYMLKTLSYLPFFNILIFKPIIIRYIAQYIIENYF